MVRNSTLLLAASFLTGCVDADIGSLFVQMDVRVVDNEDTVAAEFLNVVSTAQDSLIVALPHSEDTTLAAGVIERFDNGVDVEVVTDVDQQDDAGIQLLRDAGVPLVLNDGSITYFDFNANRDVTWTSDQVIMSHAFVVADRTRIVNATAVGNTGGGPQVVFQLQGEDLAQDFSLEHNQLFGGSDATALTAFSAPAKSQADVRWLYPTDSDTPYEFWLGPQERVTKRVIDAVYSARRSVRVMTNDFANDGLARALQEKASWGFDTEVIVGPAFNPTSQLGRVFVSETDDVTKLINDTEDDLPTVVLIDIEGGEDVRPRAFVLSHDLYSASRFFARRGGDLFEVTTDQLIDGNLSVLTDDDFVVGEDSDSPLTPLTDLYTATRDAAGDLE